MITRLRLAVGQRLFWWGHAIMPSPVRNLISMIVGIGHQWTKLDPETFEKVIEAIKADRPCKVIVTIDKTEIEYDGKRSAHE